MSTPGTDRPQQGHQDDHQHHRGDREPDVTSSFVALATALATGADVVELLSDLTATCARLLDVDSAGLLLADGLGTLHVMAATSGDTRELEVFQTQRDQGPCLDCFHSGEAVRVPDLRAARGQWPSFVEVALGMGFTSVHAVPMRLRQRRLGALGLFGRARGDLDEGDLSLGQALADVASVAIVQNSRLLDPAQEAVAVSTQLQAALAGRVLVEQAKGLIAHTGGVGLGQAHEVLRSYAIAHGQRLSEVARDVVHRRTAVSSVLAHLAVDGDGS
ncbi:GAF and ANTAR domain-containing protein [Streptomyces sp. NP160]|uniref:GAF and ANTAR domain-containing protein n=1 Tax=Streptomyces sp. NP160 TaxID=2586637 RepID=UPI0015D63A7F|nr:GAF and ANTAR domain-containing protein [Streptomyces sp. NP160]